MLSFSRKGANGAKNFIQPDLPRQGREHGGDGEPRIQLQQRFARAPPF